MRLSRSRSGTRALISLTPLIDVVFILLVFFMLASSFTEWRAIDLATAGKAVAAPSDDAALLLRVRDGGTVEIGGTPVDAAALPARLDALAQEDAERRVAVRPDAGVPLQRVVTVMEAAAGAGFAKVSLVGGAGD